MKSAILIFPHQLFKDHPALSKEREIFLVEDPLFFTGVSSSLRFHKKKLMLHRASMKAYEKRLRSQGYLVEYLHFETDLFRTLDRKKIRGIWFADPVDRALQDRLAEEAGKGKVDLHRLPTPAFLTPEDWLFGFFKDAQHYSMASFYIAQRKRLCVLLDGDNPRGGKWSFDPENRKRVPKDLPIPRPTACKPNLFTQEAKTYVENYFPSNPGSTENFFYPVTHEDAEQWLELFLKEKLQNFGDYEDAIRKDEPFLFHSVLTPMLNIGLLTPDQILKKALDVGEKSKMPLNSLEGFVRQVIGWREFMRAVYLMKGEEERTTNSFQHQRGLPQSFYAGATGLDPVDRVIRRVLQHAYAHHIERLMILGNIMVLCEIDPDEVYRWFMELFIDAYDWVMVPNVYGMSQYADGGLITTKPYISSSNYIRKMSDFMEGPWCEIWDGLCWRFLHKHREFFARNPRMRVMTNQLNRMGDEKIRRHQAVAERFLQRLA